MLTVPSTPVEDNATFSITALNSRGAGVIVSDSDYPKNVFIDTIGTRIALVDVANYCNKVHSKWHSWLNCNSVRGR